MATILIVEDNPVNQRMLGYTLQKQHHTVVTATNGREALARLTEQPYDLVISDLGMPVMDGMTLLKEVRADEQYKRVPFVMLTASGQDQDRIIARAEGASAFLTKPTSSRELIETVNQLLG